MHGPQDDQACCKREAVGRCSVTTRDSYVYLHLAVLDVSCFEMGFGYDMGEVVALSTGSGSRHHDNECA